MFCHNRPTHCRPNVCVKPTTTQTLPTKVFPTQHSIVEKTCEYIVPEVYPSHTTNVTNHVYKHVKSFPQTQSFQETVSNQQFIAPPSGPVAGQMSPQNIPPQMMMPQQTGMMPQMMPQTMPQQTGMMPQMNPCMMQNRKGFKC